MLKVEAFRGSNILQPCSYCIYDNTSEGYLVDAEDVKTVISYVQTNNIEIKGIFITHCHFDHVYGIKEISDAFPSARIYCSRETFIGLKDENLNMAYMYQDEDFLVPSDEHFTIIDANSKIFCFGNTIEILQTAGHDIDCISYIVGDCIFTGDSYIPYTSVVYPWKNSNKEDALLNEKMLKTLAVNRHLKVYPGHYQ